MGVNLAFVMTVGGFVIEATTLARRIVELAEDKQAHNIVLLDIRGLSTIADFFTICSADNERQLRAIVEYVDEEVKREFDLEPRIEGVPNSGWVVLDYYDVVVHVLNAVERDYYRLEHLWSHATPVVVVQ